MPSKLVRRGQMHPSSMVSPRGCCHLHVTSILRMGRYTAPVLVVAAHGFLLAMAMAAGAPPAYPYCGPIKASDFDLIQVALNLEFLEAEYFLFGSMGKGLDVLAPYLVDGGPPPIGARKANLDDRTRLIIQEFGYQEIGHIRSIFTWNGGFPRPLLDLSARNFANIINLAMGYDLDPPFDPYSNSVSFIIATYVIPYVGMNGYVDAIPNLETYTARRLVARLLAPEAGQDGVVRTWLYERAYERVEPYNLTVADFTDAISNLRNRLGMCGVRDEGLIVPPELGAENRTESNILSLDPNSLAYSRTPLQVLRIVYGTGQENKAGGFFPEGANGRIARSLLDDSH